MAKFHVNPETGNPGECSAQAGRCPFGGDAVHYPTRENAQAAYELSNAALAVPASLSKHLGDPGMEGVPLPVLRSHHIRRDGDFIRPTEEVEARVNRWPSTYGDEADRALRHGVATMYEYAATTPRAVQAFREQADNVFDELSNRYLEDGITDTEPRGYWHDHMDEIGRINHWTLND